MMSKPLYNVVAINIKTGERRVMTERRTAEAAETFVKMAVWRRGVEEEFFILEPVKYKEY